MTMMKWIPVALVLASIAACEKTTPATKANQHKDGDGHDHKKDDGHKHKEGDDHDHDKK